MNYTGFFIVIFSTFTSLAATEESYIEWSLLLDEERNIPIKLSAQVTETESRIHALNDVVNNYAKSVRTYRKEKHFNLLIALNEYELESYNTTVKFNRKETEELAIVATFAFVPYVHEENWIDRSIKVTLNIYVADGFNWSRADYKSVQQKFFVPTICFLIFFAVLGCCYRCWRNCKITYRTTGGTTELSQNDQRAGAVSPST